MRKIFTKVISNKSCRHSDKNLHDDYSNPYHSDFVFVLIFCVKLRWGILLIIPGFFTAFFIKALVGVTHKVLKISIVFLDKIQFVVFLKGCAILGSKALFLCH